MEVPGKKALKSSLVRDEGAPSLGATSRSLQDAEFGNKRQSLTFETFELKFIKGNKTEPCYIFKPHSEDSWFTGMTLYYLNQLLVVNKYHSFIYLVGIRTEKVARLHLSSEPWDVSLLPNNQAAITLPEEHKICLVGLPILGIEGDLKVDGECHGIYFKTDRYFVSFVNPGKIQVLSLNGTIYAEHLFGPSIESLYLTPSKNGEAVYVTDRTAHAVLKMDTEANLLFKFTDPELVDPKGIVAVDNKHIAVANTESSCILLLKDNGEQLKKVNTWNHVRKPQALEFCPFRDTLYVSSLVWGSGIQSFKVKVSEVPIDVSDSDTVCPGELVGM